MKTPTTGQTIIVVIGEDTDHEAIFTNIIVLGEDTDHGANIIVIGEDTDHGNRLVKTPTMGQNHFSNNKNYGLVDTNHGTEIFH